MTPAQWARVLRAGVRVCGNSELERALQAMAREAEKIAKETE